MQHAPPAQLTATGPVGRTPSFTGSVLIIEDHALVRTATARWLRDEGFDVHEAADGEAGLAAALELRPDIVLLDLGLPRRNGWEVATALRDAGFQGGIIVVSAHATGQDMARAYNAGANLYFRKPADPQAVYAGILRLLSHR